MSVLSKIFGGGAKALLGGVEGIIDNVVTTDEERQELKVKMKRMLEQFALEHEAELTKRHKNDMMSDSWLSKNVRPLSLVFSTFVVTLMTFTDGNLGEFVISDAYITLFQNLMLLQYGFYFGSRGLEKFNATKAAKELEKERMRGPRVPQEQKDFYESKKVDPSTLN
jgi:hypothetical protein